jgi:predicted TIM-barrel fold metal-dependent hydrolase
VSGRPGRFGLFETVPLPDAEAATAEAVRALDHLKADGLILLANAAGSYLGSAAHDELFAELDARSGVVLVHPARLPGPDVPGVPAFAADFLLDTTRAAYLLVRNGVITRYPRIRFILSHAGGFVPYAAHRLAVSLAADTGSPTLDFLEQFRSFYFDTALSSSPSALPALLAIAQPERVLFGSDWPFAPAAGVQYFTTGLDTHPMPPETKDRNPGRKRRPAVPETRRRSGPGSPAIRARPGRARRPADGGTRRLPTGPAALTDTVGLAALTD